MSRPWRLISCLAVAAALSLGGVEAPAVADDIPAVVADMAAPSTTDGLATFYWNLYQALLAKGFTQDQAVTIAAAQGLKFRTSD